MSNSDGRDDGDMASSIRTGLRDLDVLIGGLFPQRLYLVSGSTSHGKTALALGLVREYLPGEPRMVPPSRSR